MIKIKKLALAGVLGWGACALAWDFSGEAWAIEVTSAANDGAGSLRAAITAVNAPNQTITFATSVTSITLSTPLPVVTFGGLSITGTIDGSGVPVTSITSSDLTDNYLLGCTETANGLTLSNLRFTGITRTDPNSLVGGGLISISSNSTATLGNLSNLQFTGNTVDISSFLQGGGLVGAYSNNGAASVGDIGGTATSFTGNTVDISSFLQGGGLVGARSYEGAASVGDIGGGAATSFTGNTVSTTGSLQGGGLVGASVLTGNGNAEVGTVNGTFGGAGAGNTITVGAFLEGGGLVGARSYEGAASVGDIGGGAATSFTGNTVSTTGSLLGGGLVGASSSGAASVGDIGGGAATSFTGNTVTTTSTTAGYLWGGGLVGAYSSSGTASVGDIGGGAATSFTGNTVTTTSTTAGYLWGGGLVGAYSSSGTASVGTVNGTFGGAGAGNTITVGTYLEGGGLVGASSSGAATVGAVNGTFGGAGTGEGNTITVGAFLQGGGLVGAYSSSGTASVGDIGGGAATSFTGNTVSTTGSLLGGGLVGASSHAGAATVGAVNGTFGGAGTGEGNTITVGTFLQGGGLVGASSHAGAATVGDIGGGAATSFTGNTVSTTGSLLGGGLVGASVLTGNGNAEVGTVNGTFGGAGAGNTITVGTYLEGGGLVGASSHEGAATVGDIGGTFTNNKITVGTQLLGGGVIGAFSYNNQASLGNVTGADFTGNTTTVGATGTADVWALSGVLAAPGQNAPLTITDSSFLNNSISLSGAADTIKDIGAGAVFIGTSYGGAPITVNLTATSGKETVFSGNTVTVNGTARNNSLMFGRSVAPNTFEQYASSANAVLNINPEIGGAVKLLDPIKVDMDSGKTFTMNINGPGDFTWAGDNQIAAPGGAINFLAGSNTTLERVNGAAFNLAAPNQTVTVANGANLLVEPGLTSHQITSGAITLESGSKVGVTHFGYGPKMAGGAHTVLTLTSANLSNHSGITNTSGTISSGVWDYSYSNLAWSADGSQLVMTVGSLNPGPGPSYPIPATGTYNVTRAASDATSGPGAMAITNRFTYQLADQVGYVLNRLKTPSAEDKFGGRMWLSPSYSHVSQDAQNRYHGYDVNSPGVALGYDRQLGNNGVLGLAMGYSQPDYESPDADLTADDFGLAVYGGMGLPSNFKVNAALGYSWQDYDQVRRVGGERYGNLYDGNLFFVSVGLHKRIPLTESLTLAPGVSYDYLSLATDGYTERPGLSALRVEGVDQNLHRFQAGMVLENEFESGLIVGGELAYVALCGDRRPEAAGAFVMDPLATADFISLGNELEKNSVKVGVNASLPLSQGWAMGGGVDLLVNDSATAPNVTFYLQYNF